MHLRSPLLALLASLAAGCGALPRQDAASRPLRVVAAENFWGSLAIQLAGSKANVSSIIVNPAQDPHSYEPTAADARALAQSRLAIVNGVGYDPWVQRLLSANADDRRIILDIGQLLNLHEGENPHRWYSPADVDRVIVAITSDLQRLDPHDASYFAQRRVALERSGLAAYHSLIARIRLRYAGVPVGASESIFALQAPALGLRLITPYNLMKSISEGTDVTAQDTLITERQIREHQIEVWIYNSQNATPAVQRLNALARAAGIPLVTVTETLSPASERFQLWQVSQLRRILSALRRATGR
ncbi:MAG: metal ABC transporter solute-binding protein, Zn/Mn family [Solirubrobacteraceae bacterium]